MTNDDLRLDVAAELSWDPKVDSRAIAVSADDGAVTLIAFSLLGVGGLLALPVLALPAILAGVPASPGFIHTALLGMAGFVLFAIFGAVLLVSVPLRLDVT
jgi:hypothetical protein